MKSKQGKKTYRDFAVTVKGVDKENATLEAIFSSQVEDRHGDTVIQEGLDLKNFKKNPVIINNHNYNDATEVIGKASNVKVEKKKLQGKIQFAVDANPKAKIIFDLYAGGFLNAFSIGFIPKAFKENDPFTITEGEVIEVSAVGVPANPQALAKFAVSKGIEVDDSTLGIEKEEEDQPEEEELDEEEKVDEPVDEVVDEEEAEEEPEVEETPQEKVFRMRDELKEAEQEADMFKSVEVPTPAPAVKTLTPAQRALKAINAVESKEKQNVRKAKEIIDSLLDGDVEHKNIAPSDKKKVFKRKVNQAVRELLKAK